MCFFSQVQTQMVQFSLKSSQVVDLLIRKLSNGSYHFTRLVSVTLLLSCVDSSISSTGSFKLFNFCIFSGLDVNRTDRSLEFYEKKENMSKLWDILSVYAWIDQDVGYCQGMSDLCSPMIVLLEDEADSFFCFERLMRRLVLVTFNHTFNVSFFCVWYYGTKRLCFSK